jgi:hypothetical protein
LPPSWAVVSQVKVTQPVSGSTAIWATLTAKARAGPVASQASRPMAQRPKPIALNSMPLLSSVRPYTQASSLMSSLSWTRLIQSLISICCGHLASHSPQAMHTSARSSAGMCQL